MTVKAWIPMWAACAALVLYGCAEDDATTTGPASNDQPSVSLSRSEMKALAAEVRQLTAGRGITPLERPAPVRAPLVRLGEALAFDKELSGNRDISCMTCHLPQEGTGDGRSLAIGQGATGLGADRVHPTGAFIPRNAPPLFNLFAMRHLFWDGRVNRDESSLFHTPAGAAVTPDMIQVFEFGSLSALGLFPVVSREEMRADAGNELALISDDHPEQVWQALMVRLGRIPEYRQLFEAAYPGRRFDQMTFAHASNAIAGFLVEKLAFNNSPWDRFLRGNDAAMTPVQLQGAKNFMSARCSVCHNGATLSDDRFHNVAVIQFGPGKGDGPDFRDDFGRFRETGIEADRYAFRTPPLRNVELTAPYGHDGAFFDLREFVDHYSESDVKLMSFTLSPREPLLQNTALNTRAEILLTRDILLDGVFFPPQVVDEVTEFMKALTDPAARNLQRIVPGRVPSGLPVDGGLGGR
ncbi:MAG: Di-heme cytochrome c peroxidase [Geminicoccaceae bacterium]|nr:Di-heme cytochrome c peroxidase [Geminicoccaceae bacterium]